MSEKKETVDKNEGLVKKVSKRLSTSSALLLVFFIIAYLTLGALPFVLFALAGGIYFFSKFADDPS